MFKRSINQINDVKAFFTYLIVKEKINFHPDNDFNDYINLETCNSSFSLDEASFYNELLDDAFEVCHASHNDIYQIGQDILKSEIH